MSLRFACADFTFPLLPHDKVIKLIGLLGFEGIDVGLFENRSHLQPSGVLNDPLKNGKILKQKTDNEGLKVADVFLQCDVDFMPKAINHPNKIIREEARSFFEKTVEYAVASGSKHVTCLPGVHFTEESYDKSYGRTIDELNWRIDITNKAQLIFGVEPHLGSIIDTPKKAEKLVKDTKGLTLTLDYTHFTKVGMPDEEVEPLIPYATHFHARGAKKGALQTVLSENTIDYIGIVKALKAVGYTGFIGIEYIWIDWENCNRTDNISESIQLMEIIKKADNGEV